ncbi:MAG: hypothetical protein JSS32_01040 [Verrucomicrobia bacterium]|nr:hypothetical protein [Verrucomicrobiota bacterium]
MGGVSLFLLFRCRFNISRPPFLALLFLIPFQLIAIYTFASNGIENFGFAASFFVGFIFLPTVFLFILFDYIENIDIDQLTKLIKTGILFVSTYGIILFTIKLTTGKLIEIPFLTINYHDMGEIENKCNERGFIFKLISTYNNGNLYGISLLIFFPLYCHLEKYTWKKSLVISSLLLTFSRTVWIGLIFSGFISAFFLSKNQKTKFLKLIIFPILIISVLLIFSICVGFDLNFLLDRSLGGRSEQFQVLKEATFFSGKPFIGILEIVYLGILEQFGVLGLVFYIAAIFSPIVLCFLFYSQMSQLRMSALCGLLTYLFVSLSDGALLFIPVLAFFWFLAALSLSRNFCFKP